nr:ubiquitin carboxyl-terminal hydrolase 12-like [Tanacetum cinerariifolium]
MKNKDEINEDRVARVPQSRPSELQGPKSLEVSFHHATKDEVVVHTITLPKQSTVGDMIKYLKTKVESSHQNTELRLLECELKKGTAKVSWKMVCRPKSQGGLSLKDMSIWNETLISKHLWNIAEIASIPVAKLNPNTPDTTLFWVTNKALSLSLMLTRESLRGGYGNASGTGKDSPVSIIDKDKAEKRSFKKEMKQKCWNMAETVQGRDPEPLSFPVPKALPDPPRKGELERERQEFLIFALSLSLMLTGESFPVPEALPDPPRKGKLERNRREFLIFE